MRRIAFVVAISFVLLGHSNAAEPGLDGLDCDQFPWVNVQSCGAWKDYKLHPETTAWAKWGFRHGYLRSLVRNQHEEVSVVVGAPTPTPATTPNGSLAEKVFQKRLDRNARRHLEVVAGGFGFSPGLRDLDFIDYRRLPANDMPVALASSNGVFTAAHQVVPATVVLRYAQVVRKGRKLIPIEGAGLTLALTDVPLMSDDDEPDRERRYRGRSHHGDDCDGGDARGAHRRRGEGGHDADGSDDNDESGGCGPAPLGELLSLTSSYIPNPRVSIAERVSKEQAIAGVLSNLGISSTGLETPAAAIETIFPENDPATGATTLHHAWRVLVDPIDGPSWQLAVDAQSGEVLSGYSAQSGARCLSCPEGLVAEPSPSRSGLS